MIDNYKQVFENIDNKFDVDYYQLEDILNIGQIKDILEKYYLATGLYASIYDNNNYLIAETSTPTICRDFHHTTHQSEKNCLLQQNVLTTIPHDGGYISKMCPFGLWHISIPIVIGEKEKGFLILGQFFYQEYKPDRDFFVNIAKNNNFDEEKYLEVVEQIPTHSKESIQKIINFFLSLVKLIANSGYSNYLLINDLQEFVKSEKALKKSEEKFRTSMEVNPVAIIINKSGKFVYANSAAEKLVGYTKNEIEKLNIWDLIHPDYVNLLDVYQKPFIEGNLIPKYIVKFLTKESGTRWGKVKIKNYNLDEIPHSIIAIEDITHQVEIERELKEAKEKAEQSERLKTIVLNNLGHELRTPLNGILGFAQILDSEFRTYSNNIELNETIDEKKERINEQSEMLSYIIQSGKRLQNSINALLHLSELEIGSIELNLEPINLVNLVKTYFSSLEDLIKNKNISLSIHSSYDELVVEVDEYFMSQIIFNLVDNAVKFTDRGEIRIELSEHYQDDIYWAILNVIDSGTGISEDNISKIFEVFRQGSEGIERKFEGIGIGLYITQKMMNILGGKISVESRVNHGSKFSLLFPLLNRK